MTDSKSSFHLSPSAPKLRLPKGACDAHVHVFGPVSKFPYAEKRTYTPVCEAPKEKLFAMHKVLGIEHCVIVQAGCHGYDNSATEDAIAATSGRYAGVALVPLEVSDAELRRLEKAGFRGARFHYMQHLSAGPSIEDVIAFANRLEPIGWHLQIHCEGYRVAELAPWLKKSPIPVVIDHMARVDASKGVEHADFKALLDLMQTKHCWVKVSGPERCTRQGPPYKDATPFGKTLVAEFGDRCVWGTDWPHPNLNHVPDDGMLADLIAEIAPTEASRERLLVQNPKKLYRFTPL